MRSEIAPMQSSEYSAEPRNHRTESTNVHCHTMTFIIVVAVCIKVFCTFGRVYNLVDSYLCVHHLHQGIDHSPQLTHREVAPILISCPEISLASSLNFTSMESCSVYSPVSCFFRSH